MVVIRTIAAWLLLAAVCLGQAQAVIKGPTESQAGNLVVLNNSDSIASKVEWIIPETLEGRYLLTDEHIAFAVRDEGSFTFHLVAVTVDETDAVDISVATHVVTITDGFGACPDPDEPGDPSDPDDPTDPQPVPDFAKLTDISKQALAQLSDPATASKLATVLGSIKAQPLDEMRLAVSAAIEAVMLTRDRDSQDKDWLGVWRMPLDKELAALNIASSETYKAALSAIAKGLGGGGSAPTPTPEPSPKPTAKVIVYSRPDCSWCNRWKTEVMPKLTAAGWSIEEQYSSGSVPQFDVVYDGKTERLIGYQSEQAFNQFLADFNRAVKKLKTQ